jgi:23S rRNA pseudouridine2605 synthase
MKERRVPLGRAVSKLGLASRSEARELIAAGRVTVNGRVVRDTLACVDVERSRIAVDGVTGELVQRLVIALHKPRGVVTTRIDPQGRPTVHTLISDIPERVVPVGRLDLATSGLILLTNDTQFGDWLTSPQSGVPKVYLVTVRGHVEDQGVQQLKAGVEDRGKSLAPASVQLRKASTRESHLVVTLTEGKNREIRRLCAAAGYEVTRLRRVQIGGLELGRLAPGKWRRVNEAELVHAFPGYAGFGPVNHPRFAVLNPVSSPPARGTRPGSSRRR